ncbi:MAG: type VI secretion system ImpA family N-terminal domain-containing protein [Gemmataceae bacterium]|nr:type VI secretion system ImpA family N-terminal domain-containing protein [Gemmataceae bacterium]
MPTADLLDFAALAAPIPGDEPAGTAGDFYTVRRLLDECRTSHDPEQFPPGTPEREQEKRDPNWPKIISEAKSHLSTKCKHLVYAVRMCEGLVMQFGFAGVRDGLKLLHVLMSECWDRLFPVIEEAGDEAARIAQVNWLGDPVSGAFYPTKIRKTPLFGSLSWQSWKDGQGDFEAAVASTPYDKVQTLHDDIEGALQALRELSAVCDEKVPDEPAELGEVTRALTDCLNLTKQALQKKGGGGGGEIGGGGDGSAGGEMGSSGGMMAGGGIAIPNVGASRDALYEAINRLAESLEKLEPHSPVPMILKKITKLGPLNFPKLVDELTKDRNILEYMRPDESE